MCAWFRYRIAQIDLSPLHFNFSYANGGSNSKIRFSLRSAPPGFLIDPATAEIQGRPENSAAGKTFETDLLAVDPANAEHVLETIVFTITDPLELKVVLETPFERREGGFHDVNSVTKKEITGSDTASESGPDTYFTGKTYTIAAPIVSRTHLTDRLETEIAAITYSLSKNAPKTFYVQAATGKMSGRFTETGTTAFQLIAVDSGGRKAVVESHEFFVIKKKEFQVREFTRNTPELSGSNTAGRNHERCTGDRGVARSSCNFGSKEGREHWFAAGQRYLFAPINLNGAGSYEGTEDSATDIDFRMDGAPPGFLIDPTDGFIQGTPAACDRTSSDCRFTVSIFAFDTGDQESKVDSFVAYIDTKDENDPANGPNGAGCNDGIVKDGRGKGLGEVGDDPTLFDDNFTCTCTSTNKEGANCDQDKVSQSASSDAGRRIDTGELVAIVVGVLLTFFLVGLMFQHRMQLQLAKQTFNFEAQIGDLLLAGDLDPNFQTSAKIPREITRAFITFTDQLGEGAFGEVT